MVNAADVEVSNLMRHHGIWHKLLFLTVQQHYILRFNLILMPQKKTVRFIWDFMRFWFLYVSIYDVLRLQQGNNVISVRFHLAHTSSEFI